MQITSVLGSFEKLTWKNNTHKNLTQIVLNFANYEKGQWACDPLAHFPPRNFFVLWTAA